jgi:hypothetical protein
MAPSEVLAASLVKTFVVGREHNYSLGTDCPLTLRKTHRFGEDPLTMKKSLLALAIAAFGLVQSLTASAQDAILSEMYGRGVHAYYSGNNTEASKYLSMAIDNGSKDPRVYYFRGLVAHASGNSYEAESDWQRGAELEASGSTNLSVGRSLARFQGSGRIKLEEIRQKARLQFLATANTRSKQRYGELGDSAATAPVAPAASAPAITPPPAPAAAENPFADEVMAQGEPNVVADDALEAAKNNPFADDPVGDAAPAGADSPFGGEAPADDNPFGGGDAAPAMDDNPFGGDAPAADAPAGDAPAADDNPFD